MFCHNCGKEIPEGAQFCTNCGTPVGGTAPASGAAPAASAAPAAPVAKKKSQMNIIGIIAGFVLILATFMPFVSVSFLGASMSQSLMDGGDGIIFLIIAAVAILFAFLGKNIIIIIAGIAAAIVFFIENAALSDGLKKYGAPDYLNELASSLIQKGAGYYLILIGTIGLIVAGVIGIMQKKK